MADLFDPTLVNPPEGGVDVATYASPIEVTTRASIEGGADIVVGTTPISATESASVLVRALDNTNLQSSIATGPLSDLTEFDFVSGKIGLNRDTRAYIGDIGDSGDSNDDALRTTLHNAGDSASGVVKVSAEHLGSVTGEVFSDFLEYRSTTFARETLLAYVENADLNVDGLEVRAGNSSAYATVAEENSNTVRGVATAYVRTSTVTAGAAGVTLSAVDESSYSATSDGQGNRSSLNDVRRDVSAYVADSEIAVTDGDISISAENQSALNATSTLTAAETYLATANIFAINVVNGNVEAYADASTLTTTNTGNISLEADNAATIDARVKGQATATSDVVVPIPALTFGSALAFNGVGWDMANVLLATIEDFVGGPAND